MISSVKAQYIAELFSDEAVYERCALDIRNEKDRKEVVRLLADDIVTGPGRNHLHFAYIKKLSDIDTKKLFPELVHSLIHETVHLLRDELKCGKKEAKDAVMRLENLAFITMYAKRLYARYAYILMERMADTLLERIASLADAERATPLLKEAVEGKNRVSMMTFDDGTAAAVSIEQAWKHLYKANKARKLALQAAQTKLSEMLRKLEGRDMQGEEEQALLDAYEAAKKEVEETRAKGLEAFSPAVKRMKRALTESIRSGRM